ncbi:MAM and LDL-receptor class A domain-containing protein 1-like [Tetranychus urticae]|nr:MAM and LDL-receptor class A domain-containing protein 1-like [Tetranychus urticae]
MHYKYTDYSRDGKLASLLPIDTKVRPEDLGSSTFLTKQDISKINTLYRCETNSCPQPNLNAHVIIKSSTDFNIGSKVTYSCDASGFSLVGSSTQICLSTGSWSGQRPRCVPVVSHYCDFESTDCGWIAASGDVDWEISSGRKHYRTGTGPLTDLTLGTLDGHFLRLDTQNLDTGLKAIIATPNLPLSSSGVTFCLDFGYYMWGLVVGSLRVNLVTQTGSTQLFSKSGASGPKWLEKRIPFTPDGSFKLEFVATIGSELGDIAIDDVSIEPCSSAD